MSSRKPKAVVINDDNNSDEEQIPKSQVSLGKNKKLKSTSKKKINVRIGEGIQDDEDNLELKNININVKKTKNRMTGLSIPLLNDFEDLEPETRHTITSLQKQASEQKLKDVIVSPIMQPQTLQTTESNISKPPKDYIMEKIEIFKGAPEYIALDVDEGRTKLDNDEGDEDDFFNQEEDVLNDGRLALTDKELSIQKKLHDMEIEEALYEAEISPDEALDDWEASKMKQGSIHNTNETNRGKLPKFKTIDDEPLNADIEKLRISLQTLADHKLKVQGQLLKSLQNKDTNASSLTNTFQQLQDLKE